MSQQQSQAEIIDKKPGLSRKNLFQFQPKAEISPTFSIICKLCENYICIAAETKCSHVFCSRCIGQYVLFHHQCPVCSSEIRNHIFYSNIVLDNMIFETIEKHDADNLPSFQKKMRNFRQFKQKSKIQEYKKRLFVDIRDKNYIWRIGKILDTYLDKHGRISKVLVGYDRLQKELINIHEQRMVVKGTFTSRKQIPHYYRKRLAIKIQEKFYYIEQQKEQPQKQKGSSQEQKGQPSEITQHFLLKNEEQENKD